MIYIAMKMFRTYQLLRVKYQMLIGMEKQIDLGAGVLNRIICSRIKKIVIPPRSRQKENRHCRLNVVRPMVTYDPIK